jgi:dual specificity tyrosine-phosphorylation-regulated kinase 2/3/4
VHPSCYPPEVLRAAKEDRLGAVWSSLDAMDKDPTQFALADEAAATAALRASASVAKTPPFVLSRPLGSTGAWTKLRGSTRAPLNHGYDDERGEYRLVAGDHVGFRFEVLESVGSGSFGSVWKCRDHKSGELVAIKIVRNRRRYHKQARVEVQLLTEVRDADRVEEQSSGGVVHFRGSFYFRHHLCLVFPLLHENLYDLLRLRAFRGLPLAMVRSVGRQLFRALQLCRRHRIIHADLKPENVLLLRRPTASLLTARSAATTPSPELAGEELLPVRVIDFGSGCKEDRTIYAYIQSRFYRAPEVILNLPYGCPIDVWSVGCILAELWSGNPVFAGEDEREQLLAQMAVCGAVDTSMALASPRAKAFFDEEGMPVLPRDRDDADRFIPGSRSILNALAPDPHDPRREEAASLAEFLARVLVMDPAARISPAEALRHPFLHQHAPRQNAARRPGRFLSEARSDLLLSTQSPHAPERPKP